MHNPYLALTEEFNQGALRALLSSGQAVVAHRLAVMSKDGDWIVREDQGSFDHVLGVLATHGARYRFGAPLDTRWLSGGWSSHLEFAQQGLRLRTDFVSRPPRISPVQLRAMWSDADTSGNSVIGLVPLAAIKLTNREKDYAVIGELARTMRDPKDQLLFSRSARDILELAKRHPDLVTELGSKRELLTTIAKGRPALEAALDHERRQWIHKNERRLAAYAAAAKPWAKEWPALHREIEKLPLAQAHARVVARADGVLPFEVVQE